MNVLCFRFIAVHVSQSCRMYLRRLGISNFFHHLLQNHPPHTLLNLYTTPSPRCVCMFFDQMHAFVNASRDYHPDHHFTPKTTTVVCFQVITCGWRLIFYTTSDVVPGFSASPWGLRYPLKGIVLLPSTPWRCDLSESHDHWTDRRGQGADWQPRRLRGRRNRCCCVSGLSASRLFVCSKIIKRRRGGIIIIEGWLGWWERVDRRWWDDIILWASITSQAWAHCTKEKW